MIVFDKAKYHYEGDYPAGLSREGAYVATGIYVAWCGSRGLLSELVEKEFGDTLMLLLDRRVGPIDLYKEFGGVFTEQHLSVLGVKFSCFYFDFDDGTYLDDFIEYLAADLPSIYHVQGSWDSFDAMKPCIDKRYEEWLRRTSMSA